LASAPRAVRFDHAHVSSDGCQLRDPLAHIDYFSPDNVVWFADVSHETLESRARVGDVQHACERWLQLVSVNYDDVDDGHFLLDLFNDAHNCGPFLGNDRGSCRGFYRDYVTVGIDCSYSGLRRVDCSFHLDCSAARHELFDNAKLYSWNNELPIQLLYHGCSGDLFRNSSIPPARFLYPCLGMRYPTVILTRCGRLSLGVDCE